MSGGFFPAHGLQMGDGVADKHPSMPQSRESASPDAYLVTVQWL